MVFFKIVESRSFWYFFFRKWLVFIFCGSYYRRFHVRGRKHVPKEGTPILMVSNHQNGLIDALGILFSLPLRYKVVFLARADIFKKKILAKILNFCKIMPIFRQRDGKDNLGENAAIFNESAKLLKMGFPVTLFPEGQHQEGHYLGPLKKGFARIAFDAAEQNGFPENLMIVPVGNHYSSYFSNRASMCISYGQPIPLASYYPLYHENPARALTQLTEDLRPAIRGLMLDIPDRENYGLYDRLREVVRGSICRKMGLRASYLPHQLDADREFAMRIEQSSQQTMEQVRAWGRNYLEITDRLKVPTSSVENPLGFFGFIGNILAMLIGLPFAVYGICFTGLPVYLGRRKSKQLAIRMKNMMLRTSVDFVLTQILMQAVFYFIYIVLYWIFFDSFLLFIGLLASWVLTRMIWQDYLHMAGRMLRRMRAVFLKGKFKEAHALLKQLQAWACQESCQE